MEEKNMDEIKEYLWTEYDGEDVDVSKFPKPTKEELDDDEDFLKRFIEEAKDQQSKKSSYIKKEDGKSIFEIVKENMTDK